MLECSPTSTSVPTKPPTSIQPNAFTRRKTISTAGTSSLTAGRITGSRDGLLQKTAGIGDLPQAQRTRNLATLPPTRIAAKNSRKLLEHLHIERKKHPLFRLVPQFLFAMIDPGTDSISVIHGEK